MRVRRSPLAICFSLPLAAAAVVWSADARAQSVWADVDVGAGRVAIPQSFGDYVPTKVDLAFGLGVGVRFSAWTFGVRGHVVPTSSFTFYQGALEAGFRPSVGRWDPYVSVHGGYAVMGMHAIAFPFSVDVAPGEGPQSTAITPANPRGPDLGLGFGVDYRVTSLFTLGIGLTGDALFLTMPASYFTAPTGEPVLVMNPGSGVGSAVIASVHAGWWFEI